MARSAARLKMGFFPLPESEAKKIHSLLRFPHSCSVIDPCAGRGAALNLITKGAQVERHGIELDTRRTEQAAASGIRMIQGNVFDTHAKTESFSLLYLNPPYDSEINLTGNRRMERMFLEHTHHWLVQNGILVFVIPFEQLDDCANTLSGSFTRITVLRMADTESVRFRQVVIFGVRRNIRGAVIEQGRSRLRLMAGHDGYHRLAVLEPGSVEPFAVPSCGEATMAYRGLPYDLIEDTLPGSAAWKQAAPTLLAREDTVAGRPITPLHGGHVGLLCTAGLLNGVFGQGADRHVARWRSVKHVTEFHEVDGDTKIVRRREKWSNELRLIYAHGKAMKLTENTQARGEADGECAPEDGNP
jgi:16S rRNA G966 N2-methylase RsmD